MIIHSSIMEQVVQLNEKLQKSEEICLLPVLFLFTCDTIIYRFIGA